jgi:adenosylcobinamide-GDP ribazoletransferase
MQSGFITAIRTLTAIPIPGRDSDRLASSLPWFPIVGFLLGGFLYAITKLIGLIDNNSWPQGSAIVATGLGILLTKGFHLDGLADFSDAFGNWRDKDKTLAIMKDPHTGVFGVVSIVFILLVKWISLSRIIASGSAVCIISAYIVSRAMLVELASTLPYARIGNGTAAPFIHGSRPRDRFITMILTISMLSLINGLAGIAISILGWIVCRFLGLWSKKRIGGVTGDVLGACSELIETMTFFICAMLGQRIQGLYF